MTAISLILLAMSWGIMERGNYLINATRHTPIRQELRDIHLTILRIGAICTLLSLILLGVHIWR